MSTALKHSNTKAFEILTGINDLLDRIAELEAENRELREIRGMRLNKTKAARYLGYTPQHLNRLAKQYPGRLQFTDGEISIRELDEFEAYYETQKWRRND